MSNYRHNPAPNHRAKQFIQWCKENVKEWPADAVALASFTGSKFSKYCERAHYKGLSYSWSVCTYSQWRGL